MYRGPAGDRDEADHDLRHARRRGKTERQRTQPPIDQAKRGGGLAPAVSRRPPRTVEERPSGSRAVSQRARSDLARHAGQARPRDHARRTGGTIAAIDRARSRGPRDRRRSSRPVAAARRTCPSRHHDQAREHGRRGSARRTRLRETGPEQDSSPRIRRGRRAARTAAEAIAARTPPARHHHPRDARHRHDHAEMDRPEADGIGQRPRHRDEGHERHGPGERRRHQRGEREPPRALGRVAFGLMEPSSFGVAFVSSCRANTHARARPTIDIAVSALPAMEQGRGFPCSLSDNPAMKSAQRVLPAVFPQAPRHAGRPRANAWQARDRHRSSSVRSLDSDGRELIYEPRAITRSPGRPPPRCGECRRLAYRSDSAEDADQRAIMPRWCARPA